MESVGSVELLIKDYFHSPRTLWKRNLQRYSLGWRLGWRLGWSRLRWSRHFSPVFLWSRKASCSIRAKRSKSAQQTKRNQSRYIHCLVEDQLTSRLSNLWWSRRLLDTGLFRAVSCRTKARKQSVFRISRKKVISYLGTKTSSSDSQMATARFFPPVALTGDGVGGGVISTLSKQRSKKMQRNSKSRQLTYHHRSPILEFGHGPFQQRPHSCEAWCCFLCYLGEICLHCHSQYHFHQPYKR